MTNIKITYIDGCLPYRNHYIYVKVIHQPKIVGHQALKNIDWVDRDYWPEQRAYYRQVTEKQINDRYQQLNLNIYRSHVNEEMLLRQTEEGMGVTHVIKPMPNVPLTRIPQTTDSG